MNPAIPTCRYFLLCMDGRVTEAGEGVVSKTADGGEVELLPNTGDQILLMNPVIRLRPEPNGRYPAMFDQLLCFAQLSDGHGLHGFSIELLRWYQGQPYQMFQTPETPLDLGSDRAATRVYRSRLKTVWFPTAGQYTFLLKCDGIEIDRAELELLEPS